MKNINFNYQFIYFNKDLNLFCVLKETKKESIESAKSGLALFNAYRVVKVKVLNNGTLKRVA